MRGWQFADNLYVMGTPRLADIEALHVTAVLNVAKKVTPPEVTSVVKFCHYPIKDGQVVDAGRFWQAANLVNTWLDGGERVIVHCLAGRNRSVLVATLALRQRGVLQTGPEALEFARARRPRCLWNPAFETYLRELA